METKLNLYLTDKEWKYDFISHDRDIVRAIIVDDDQFYYFMHMDRDDAFGRMNGIETSGGGVEANETFEEALKRELKEEMGSEVEILAEIGFVSDYYHLIHRHNLNHYYLCRLLAIGNNHLTLEEKENYHLTRVKLTYQEAKKAYKANQNYPLGRLITQRELPILKQAKKLLDHEKSAR